MHIETLRLSAARFNATLLSATNGSIIELEHQGAYYCGKLVRVTPASIVIAPRGRASNKPSTPSGVFNSPVPLSSVIGFETRGQRFKRV